MSASHFWTLFRLSASGRAIPKLLLSAKTFFQQQFHEAQDIRSIQSRLFELSQSFDQTTAQLALLCLRCYVSYQIVSTCMRLVERFGDRYSFKLTDILPFVLDDQGRTEFKKTLSFEILQTFNPDKGSLSTWTTRFVQQRPDLTRFFAQQGLLLISNWALLNDTTEKQLCRILSEVYLLSSREIDRSIALLNAYHSVYRNDPNRSGRCIPPSIAQLKRIAQHLDRSDSTDVVMSRLNRLATYVRQYRVWCRRGAALTCPIDLAILQPVEIDQQVCPLETRFLRRYRQALVTELDAAIRDVLTARMQKIASEHYLLSLYGLYCEHQTMRSIAVQLGLPGQYRVVRLLQLAQLRSTIQTQLIERLKPRLAPFLPVASIDLDRILQEELEPLFKLDAQYLQTPIAHRSSESRSLFTLRMVHCLEKLFTERRILQATMAQAG
ncbi:hypothetical protein IQ250_12855 [Pseudanabaenaceae cyanobacterium LEGE 13415]|nr:hypothetical protein [Pseudanabaenaceae cyanobacterium LEGE 13415]